MRGRAVVALNRHRDSEVAGAGSSQGTQFLFTSIQDGLAEYFELRLIPTSHAALRGKQALRLAFELLSDVDACLFGLSRTPFELDPFLLLRSRITPSLPVLYMPLGELPRGAWCYRHISQFLTYGDAVLFSSHADLAVHKALVETTPARTPVVPFGIDIARFQVGSGVREHTRAMMGVTEDEVVFIYHGRLSPEKNVHGVIMLFRQILSECVGARLWIVGDIEDHSLDRDFADTMKSIVRTSELGDRLTFLGAVAVETIPRLLAAADIAINLSTNGDENFGYGIVEAMATGLPVIATDWGGFRDTVADGSTGFKIPTIVTDAGIAIDCRRALQVAGILANNAGLRRRLGHAARQRASENYSLSHFINALANEIETSLASQDRRPAPLHLWSGLGESLIRTYSDPVPENPDRSIPCIVLPGPHLFAKHPLMRDIVAPYASRQAGPTDLAKSEAVLTFASSWTRWRGDTLESLDPRYPFSFSVTPLEKTIINFIDEQPQADIPILMQRLGWRFGREHVSSALARLLNAGVLVVSMTTPPAFADAQTEIGQSEAIQ